jgi:cytochrome P450
MLDKSFSMSSKIGLLPELWPSILKCLRFFNKPSPVTLLKISEGYLAKYREESRAIKGNTNDEPFVAKIIGLEAKGKMTRWDAIGVCSSNVAAGSDTTAITLSSALYHIYKDPKILQRLREELDTMENNGKISNPVTFQQAQNMPYLQAVVKEALRVHPAVGVPLVRVVPEGGAEINGYFFPEGVRLLCSPSCSG